MIFRDYKKDYEDKYNAELNKTGVFYAFSKEQFNQNKTKKDASDSTEIITNASEQQYKYYASRVIDLTEQLENTPKIFKSKRAKLEQEIKEMQDKSDKHFNNYLKGCEDIYNLHQELFKD